MLCTRRVSLALFILSAAAILDCHSLRAAEPIDPAQAKTEEGDPTRWFDIRLLGLEGKAWTDTEAPFDRLPKKAKEMVRPPVWNLSRNSAGMCVRFVTDAPTIQARWTLTSSNLAMNHMPATGVSGLDLYVEVDSRWRWLAVGRPTAQTNKAPLVTGLPVAKRTYLLYLPLYNGVSSVEIGLPPEHGLAKADPRGEAAKKPLLFYGTSITQGGCASRPGMVHTAIVGRRLGREVVNLGFSGNGKMEPELATLLAELDPAVYILDCLPNLGPAETAERVEPFVKALRKARPDTPILLVEDRNYTDGFLIARKAENNKGNHAALREAFKKLAADGVKGLYYLPADTLLSDDGEGTVDGSHPTDVGFLQHAAAFEKALAPLLK
jgi:hypothetical protein